MSLFARAVGAPGIAALILACAADPDEADQSPFFLWGIRPGMPFDSAQQFLIRQDNMPWSRCDDPGVGRPAL